MTRNEVIEILRHCASEDKCPDGIVGNCYGCNRRTALDMAIEALSEDISEDGTLTVKVKDGSKVNRVLVWGDNHFGGLYYPDKESDPEGTQNDAK